jgi:hypothetical protein
VIDPIVAAAAMTASSLAVVLNSLRARIVPRAASAKRGQPARTPGEADPGPEADPAPAPATQ